MTKVIVAVVVLVGAVGGAAFYVVQKDEPPDIVAGATPPDSGLEAASPATVPDNVVDSGLYFDWNWGSGPLAEAVRPHVAEPLVEVHSTGRTIYRLATALRFAEGDSEIDLKDSIYWSDETRLIASHVAAAFDRALAGAAQGEWEPRDQNEYRWLKTVKVAAENNTLLRVRGITNEEDLRAFAASNLLSPVRMDLLEGDPRDAWTVSLGRYTLKEISLKPLPRGSKIEFVPNTYYYKGKAQDGLVIEVDPLFPKQAARLDGESVAPERF